jgi:hypothetical protein
MWSEDNLVPLFMFLGSVTIFTSLALSVRRVKGWPHDQR